MLSKIAALLGGQSATSWTLEDIIMLVHKNHEFIKNPTTCAPITKTSWPTKTRAEVKRAVDKIRGGDDADLARLFPAGLTAWTSRDCMEIIDAFEVIRLKLLL